ncbi:YgaP family membrane protein [Rhodohalobacter halophilus]|uniref:YgaP family membrane protein n=1 Tax=Rhodohalobacter halophilus TaxID=1812810 RepID=UPI00083F685B|nr:DUF2892 domain-containing protein [Rhodohalobacter halophilus]
MKKNMGSIDKAIRSIIAVGVGVLYFSGTISGSTAIILGALAIVFLLTSFAGSCPLYMPFGISTRKEHENSSARQTSIAHPSEKVYLV